jgi:hypothetical protein
MANRQNKFFAVVLIGVFIIAASVLVYLHYERLQSANHPPQSTDATYDDTTYGFTFTYPKTITPETSFKKFYILSDTWRAEAADGENGIGLVAFPVFRIDRGGVATGKPYPLYYDAEVRIGVSNDPTVVKNCYKGDPSYTTGQTETDVTINGVQFKKFDFGGAAMMQYMSGESYRTVHNGNCFAIEQIKTGSSYRDETMAPGTPDEVLNGYYVEAGNLIQSFRFTK